MEKKSEKLENSLGVEEFLSADGKEIFITKETRKHLLAHPDVLEYLEEAIGKVKIPDGMSQFEEAIDLGRIIGKSLLVEAKDISSDEETEFALRVGREWPVRVALEAQGIECDSVTLDIIYDNNLKKYRLRTAYIGYPTPSNPYYIADKNSQDYKEAIEFWCCHALAYDPKIMGKPFKASWNSVLTRARLLS
jgi:hypothetical protein